jgi:hypothetical protein
MKNVIFVKSESADVCEKSLVDFNNNGDINISIKKGVDLIKKRIKHEC